LLDHAAAARTRYARRGNLCTYTGADGIASLDLLGIKKSDLPKIWDDLGMPSGQAYTKGVRMVKTCVGSEFCRFGTQDSMTAEEVKGPLLRCVDGTP
jgi:NAD(P)H-nitrite reductase